jgi:hypothetical protein
VSHPLPAVFDDVGYYSVPKAPVADLLARRIERKARKGRRAISSAYRAQNCLVSKCPIRPGFRRVALAHGARIKTAVPSKEQENCCGEDTQRQALFRVTLRAQPSKAAIAVHPVIGISFVF